MGTTDRFTLARDTINDTSPFPNCVKGAVEMISEAFNQVDKAMSKILRREFGDKLDVLEESGTGYRKFETLDSKTHVHLYRGLVGQGNVPKKMALPFHTDNGLYVLLTPSNPLPLYTRNRNGTTAPLDPEENTILMLLGTGLSSWLLPLKGLFAPPHGVPSLPILTQRKIVSRMVVAPSLSTPQHAPKSTFWDHFSRPLETETGSTLARIRKQRETDCSQDWPHACEDGTWDPEDG